MNFYVKFLQDSVAKIIKIGLFLTELFKKIKGWHFWTKVCIQTITVSSL